mmetsp:Transcript_1863/g.2023  ORF Transcript_1863/g.2023 Transcript_1863/m.2023 type:complete len:119 (-) Transcript_1863:71-427(-)
MCGFTVSGTKTTVNRKPTSVTPNDNKRSVEVRKVADPLVVKLMEVRTKLIESKDRASTQSDNTKNAFGAQFCCNYRKQNQESLCKYEMYSRKLLLKLESLIMMMMSFHCRTLKKRIDI